MAPPRRPGLQVLARSRARPGQRHSHAHRRQASRKGPPRALDRVRGKYLPARTRKLPGQVTAEPGGSTSDKYGRRSVSHLSSSGQILISRPSRPSGQAQERASYLLILSPGPAPACPRWQVPGSASRATAWITWCPAVAHQAMSGNPKRSALVSQPASSAPALDQRRCGGTGLIPVGARSARPFDRSDCCVGFGT
jgi:hypothetical protein